MLVVVLLEAGTSEGATPFARVFGRCWICGSAVEVFTLDLALWVGSDTGLSLCAELETVIG